MPSRNVADRPGRNGFSTPRNVPTPWTDNQAGGRSLFQGNVSNDNDDYGFYDDESYYSNWKGNIAKRNGDEGFYMYYPSFITFTGNTANRNGGDGIYAEGNYSWYNFAKFANNKANYNDDYGIEADYGISNASGNVARYNGNAPDNCYNVDCN
jgi:parallel beta-helix repeat protein